jgi:putative hydrolase of the HAD superfamily
LPKGVGWHYRDVARRHGSDLSETALDAAFRGAWHAHPAPLETRLPRPDDDKEWWRTLVGRVLDACHPLPVGFDRHAYFEELYAEFARPGVWELYPEVPEVLARLAPHFELGILSNFDGRLRLVLDHLGMAAHFRHWIISSEAGAEKPSSWLFEHALTRAGVTSAEALHVGDDPECDWQGAASAGLRVFRLDRPRNSLRELVRELIG